MDVLTNGRLQNGFRKLRPNTSNTAAAMEEGRGQDTSPGPGDRDKDQQTILHQTFTHHWEACRDRIRGYEPGGDRCVDDVVTVTAQLEQMVQLLQLELSEGSNNNSGPATETRILGTLLSDTDQILAQVVAWARSLETRSQAAVLGQLLALCEVLVSCGAGVVSHPLVTGPLLALLDTVHSHTSARATDPQLAAALLGLVHSLCVLLTASPGLLDLFTRGPGLLLLPLLTPFLHLPSASGQLARDSLLLLVSLSSHHASVQTYIADHSNLTTILATGLGGLYSALPRSLGTADSASWHRLEAADCADIPGLGELVTSLELCCAVLQVAPPRVSAQLLELIQAGFLVPVLGPALVQDSGSVSSTAYLDLFLRVLSSPALLATWVRYILTATVDGSQILEVLIERIAASGQVCIVTLQLFETLVSLNMEDVMLSLVFRHLINCNFLLPSSRSSLHYDDPHGRAAYKFLSLVPVSCDPPATPITPRRTPFFNSASGPNSLPHSSHIQSQSYAVYLSDAQNVIRQTHQDCSLWRNSYDGDIHCSTNQNTHPQSVGKSPTNQSKVTPKISVELGQDPLEDNIDFGDSGPGSLGADTSGYLSGGWDLEDGGDAVPASSVAAAVPPLSSEEEAEFWSAVGYSGPAEARTKLHQVLARLHHEDRLSMSSYGSEDVVSPRTLVTSVNSVTSASCDTSPPTLGPFLTNVMNKVSSLADNGLGTNLRLTALVSKLATFPQPLLKAVLLHPDVVVQPSCTTLFQAICVARQRIDSVMPGLLGADEAVRTAKADLQTRLGGKPRSASVASLISLPGVASLDAGIRRGGSSLLKMFTGGGRRSGGGGEGGLGSGGGVTEAAVPPHTRKMAMAAVVLEEWLQELAALAQEHSVLLQQERILADTEAGP